MERSELEENDQSARYCAFCTKENLNEKWQDIYSEWNQVKCDICGTEKLCNECSKLCQRCYKSACPNCLDSCPVCLEFFCASCLSKHLDECHNQQREYKKFQREIKESNLSSKYQRIILKKIQPEDLFEDRE